MAFGKIKYYSTDQALVTSYKQELNILGYAKNTVFTKIRNIINFRDKTLKSFQKIKQQDIREYIHHLQAKSLHSSTIQHYYTNIYQFYIYLEREQIINTNPFNYYDLKIKKQAKNTRAILSQKEIRILYLKAKKGQETILLHLCYGCGIRAKELEQINVDDVQLLPRLVRVQKGKNNQYRILPLPYKMIQDFTNYIKYRNKLQTNTKALLINKKENRLKAYTARGILQEILKRTSINKKITLHSLRHSIATHLLENGMKAQQVQQFLGHKQLETTETYTRVSTQQLKKLQ